MCVCVCTVNVCVYTYLNHDVPAALYVVEVVWSRRRHGQAAHKVCWMMVEAEIGCHGCQCTTPRRGHQLLSPVVVTRSKDAFLGGPAPP